jgi:hypothetical protein
LLIGLLGVHSEADVEFDGLIELGGRALLNHRGRVFERIQLRAI